jgi:hypothetical protein
MNTKSMLLVASVLLVGVVFQANPCSAQQVVIDSKYDSILLDSIPGPAFFSLTAGHQYRISMFGDGQPIPDRVFIMYQSQDSGLTFNVVTSTTPITFTSAFSWFYAYLTDWVDSTDNLGTDHVVIHDLTSGSYDTLHISSHDQSVMIDEQTGSHYVPLTTNWWYDVSVTASDATPIANRAYIMYQDNVKGLSLNILTNTRTLRIQGATVSWCYVWLTDWSTRWDNTGSTTVTFTPLGVEEGTKDREQYKSTCFRALPNPFYSSALITGHEADRFSLYDISGRKVGTYRGDRIGADVGSGVYFLRGMDRDSKPVRIVKVR